jgi:hypothetical protein
MNRRGFVSGVSASVFTAAASYVAFIQPADEQLVELQVKVDDLDSRVDALEAQVEELGGGEPADTEPDSEAPAPAGEAAGRYRVNATVAPSSGFFAIILEVFDPNGNSELVFNEFGETSAEWQGSSIYQAPSDGEYFLSVSNTTGAWTFEFEPF